MPSLHSTYLLVATLWLPQVQRGSTSANALAGDTARRPGQVRQTQPASDDCTAWLMGQIGRTTVDSSGLARACPKRDSTGTDSSNRSIFLPRRSGRRESSIRELQERQARGAPAVELSDSVRAWARIPRDLARGATGVALLLLGAGATWAALLTIRRDPRAGRRATGTPLPVRTCPGTTSVRSPGGGPELTCEGPLPWFPDPVDWLERSGKRTRLGDGTVVYEPGEPASSSAKSLVLLLIPGLFVVWPVAGWLVASAVSRMAREILHPSAVLGWKLGSTALMVFGAVAFLVAAAHLGRLLANWRWILMFFAAPLLPWGALARVLIKLTGHVPTRRLHVGMRAAALVLVALAAVQVAVPAAGAAARLFRDAPSRVLAPLVLLEWFALTLLLGAGSLLLASLVGIRRLGGQMLRELFWTRGVLRLSPLDVCAPAANPPRTTITIAHLSDLHLTADEATPLLDGEASPNAVFHRIVGAHRDCLRSADVLLITGDTTNAGAALEWRAFFESVGPEILERAVLLPGNHDVNITDPRDIYAIEGDSRILYKLRLIRMLSAMNAVQGDRTWVYRGDSPQTLRDCLSPFASQLRLLSERPPRYVEHKEWNWDLDDATPSHVRLLLDLPEQLWSEVFPMVVLGPDKQFAVLILDSNATNQNIVENAFGHISDAQLERIPRALKHIGPAPLLCALHHHVALPGRPLKTLARTPALAVLAPNFLVLDNALDLLTTLPRSSGLVLFHGHRHFGFHGRLGSNLTVVSAPSTTLGDEGVPPGKRAPGYYEYTVSLAPWAAAVTGAVFHGDA
jgi:hypothetical protein